jgi:5-oxoprolinase (ATP-hydrolysing)
MQQQWEFWIDRGGTFTDIIAHCEDGAIITHKLLSDNPSRYSDAALEGIRHILRLATNTPLPGEHISAIKMGTTVATNALLERKGEPTLLLTSQGFKDALEIGYQNRAEIFSFEINKPDILYQQVIEVPERMNVNGEIITPLNIEYTQQQLQQAYDYGLKSIAIVFMHSYRYPQHELQAAKIAKNIGFTQISISHKVSPLVKFISRGDTTVVDAYLTPILQRYISQIDKTICGSTKLSFMQSNGGLADANFFHGKDSILSGPAGGVIGMVETAKQAGFDKLIGFDMGGTSTDVSHYNGNLERSFENEIAGIRINAPMMQNQL